MTLSDWRKNGWLKAHQTSRQEIADLLALAERDLKDCRSKGLSDDWKFNIAYNAALQASNAALVASGYTVAKGDSNHFRVIQSLAHTIQLDPKSVADFDDRRKKRSMSIYDAAGVITRQEANQTIDFAREILARVKRWLAEQHPELFDKEPE